MYYINKKIIMKLFVFLSILLGLIYFNLINVYAFSYAEPVQAWVSTSEGDLNMRSSMSITENLITTIPNGSPVVILDTYSGWYHVSFNSYSGYVSSDFIKIGTPQAPDPPSITFLEKKDEVYVSNYSLNLLKEILLKSGLTSAKITSTYRTAHQESDSFYENCENTGAMTQKDIYGPYGDQVIDIYIEGKDEGYNKQKIISLMEEKIKEFGPEKVSKHCGDFTVCNVLDISAPSINYSYDFLNQLQIYKENQKINFIDETYDNGCYHIEIPQIKTMNNDQFQKHFDY